MPGWVWLLFGAALAAFIIIVLQLAQPKHGTLNSALTPSTANPAPGKPQKSAKIPVPPPVPSNFSFYDTLPRQQPPVAQAAAETPQPAPATTPAPPANPAQSAPPTASVTPAAPVADATWIVQVGSYRSAEEADGVRAKLALSGIATRTQKAEVNGTTWYRVRSGPLDLKSATALRDRLKAAGTSAIAMRGNG